MQFRSLIALGALTITLTISNHWTNASDLNWIRSYEAGTQKALEELKPMLVNFYASWGWSHLRMEGLVYSRSEVQELLEGFILVKIEVEKENPVAKRYAVDSLPTIIFLDPFGNELARRTGYTNADELIDLLKTIPVDFGNLSDFKDDLGPDSESFSALFAAGNLYWFRQMYQPSNQLFKRAIDCSDSSTTHNDLEMAYSRLALSSLALGDREEAERILRDRLQECKNCPMTPHFLMDLGKVYLEMGKSSEAKEIYRQLLNDYPDSEFASTASEALKTIE